MKARRLQLKLYAEPGTLADPERAVPVFHDFIREGCLGELLIDVARYGHVHRGPAVLLVGHHGDYGIDLSEGRCGLVVTRKREAVTQEGWVGLFRRAVTAAEQLEASARLEGLAFRTDEMLLSVPDRLAAPNTPETFRRLGAEIGGAVESLLGPVTLEHAGSEREPFSVRIRRTANDRVAVVAARATALA